jgi:hypothetical protein
MESSYNESERKYSGKGSHRDQAFEASTRSFGLTCLLGGKDSHRDQAFEARHRISACASASSVGEALIATRRLRSYQGVVLFHLML